METAAATARTEGSRMRPRPKNHSMEVLPARETSFIPSTAPSTARPMRSSDGASRRSGVSSGWRSQG